MLDLTKVRDSNRSLLSLPPGLVAVFAGATSGIGLETLTNFAKNVNGPRAYIIGKSKEKFLRIIEQLKSINPMGTFVFIEAQFTLISEIDEACLRIKQSEDHVDILFMSPGHIRIDGRHETSEGIETGLALQYYSRQRLLANLLPLLERSLSPRVVSILAAGFEGPIQENDLDCQKHYSALKASLSAATMTDLMFDELARQHPGISFVHSYPGIVGTYFADHILQSVPGAFWFPAQIPRHTLVPLCSRLFCTSVEEAGERALFLATSARYPPAAEHSHEGNIAGWAKCPAGVRVAKSSIMHDGVGNGVYRTDWDGESCKDSLILEKCRKQGLGRVVFEHTLDVFEQALSRSHEPGKVPSAEKDPTQVQTWELLDFEIRGV